MASVIRFGQFCIYSGSLPSYMMLSPHKPVPGSGSPDSIFLRAQKLPGARLSTGLYHWGIRSSGGRICGKWNLVRTESRIEMRKNRFTDRSIILDLKSINNGRKADRFMAYALQDEKVRDTTNHERLLKMPDGVLTLWKPGGNYR